MISFAANTHRGCIREHNEDCYHADPDAGLWLVADGVGGHTNGEIASAITSDVTHDTYVQTGDLVTAIRAAHQAVLEAIQERGNASNMGSTIVALALKGMDYHIAWVGDSRAYLWDGELKLLTRDHSYVETLIDKGVITPQEALRHPKRNIITQSIGISPQHDLKVDVVSGTLLPDQKILLCSDGLNDEVSPPQLAKLFGQALPPEPQVDELIKAALAAGGRDNVTVLILAPEEQVSKHQSYSPSIPLSNLSDSIDLDATIVRRAFALPKKPTNWFTLHRKKIMLAVILCGITAALTTFWPV